MLYLIKPYAKIISFIVGSVLIFYGGWKLRDKDFQLYIANTKAEKAEAKANELSELYQKIINLQERVTNADNELQKTKNEIDNNANNTTIKYVDRLRYTKCPAMPSTTADGGNEGDGKGGRSEQSTVDFGDVAKQIIKLGADRDTCAAKVTALQRACINP